MNIEGRGGPRTPSRSRPVWPSTLTPRRESATPCLFVAHLAITNAGGGHLEVLRTLLLIGERATCSYILAVFEQFGVVCHREMTRSAQHSFVLLIMQWKDSTVPITVLLMHPHVFVELLRSVPAIEASTARPPRERRDIVKVL